jgi:hypothetical protein
MPERDVIARQVRMAYQLLATAAAIFLLAAGGTAGTGELALKDSCRLPDPARNVARGTFEGRRAIRFALGLDDTGTCPADIRRGGYNRAELRSIENLPRGHTVTVRFDVFIPKGFAATGGIALGQFHQTDGPPLILLMASGTDYRVTPGSGLRVQGAKVVSRRHLFDARDFGRWHRIEMVARFTAGEDGFIRVASDGATRFEARGPTVRTEPYFKIGLYGRRDRMTGPLTAYVTPPEITVE